MPIKVKTNIKKTLLKVNLHKSCAQINPKYEFTIEDQKGCTSPRSPFRNVD
ncbi:hypothetical protein DVU_1166 [Nitratidesulfovibrio vulgaris str. Hildenborough]|uniref:Uncharacterized protein n=1 Tax=Nitratidesulfovibrio vulgaris (strain ATCC 29579 / DSM 644 / CCUG 34227 / NCIMB 8303 / VKM B-1760 / Hildenborough) TaxID=882 RepID=Q72CW7_NITV2|nr:hypothetical protein DVU_1166 [Nitratidesulfovibrio vulgaris str. Hildenborough]